MLLALVLCAVGYILIMNRAKQQKAAALAVDVPHGDGGYINPLFGNAIPVRSAAEVGITGYTDIAPLPPSAGKGAGGYMDVSTGGLVRDGLDAANPRAISAAGGGAMAVGYMDIQPTSTPATAAANDLGSHGVYGSVNVSGASGRNVGEGVAEACIDVHPAADGEVAVYDEAGPAVVVKPALYDRAGAGVSLERSPATEAVFKLFTAAGDTNAVDVGAYFDDADHPDAAAPGSASDGAYKMVVPYDTQVGALDDESRSAAPDESSAQLDATGSAVEAYFEDDDDGLAMAQGTTAGTQYMTVIPFDQQASSGIPPPAPPPAAVDDDSSDDGGSDDALPELPADLDDALDDDDAGHTVGVVAPGNAAEAGPGGLAGKQLAMFKLQHDSDVEIDL